MSNNHSIQILRGTRQAIYDNRTVDLLAGQPLYNTDDNYLTIGCDKTNDNGDKTNKTIGDLPIVVREVHGYSADNNGLAASVTPGTNDWKFGGVTDNGTDKVVLDVNGLPLEISVDENKTVKITQGGNVITMSTTVDGNNKRTGKVIFDLLHEAATVTSVDPVTISGHDISAFYVDATARAATNDASGNSISGTYAKQNGNYSSLGAGKIKVNNDYYDVKLSTTIDGSSTSTIYLIY